MLSPKAPGRHPTFGTIYYWCLVVVFASATALAIMRWKEDYHLFLLGALAFGVASAGRAARRGLRRAWVTWHITGMGLSYIVLLTAFYVDNGKSLPLWKELPPISYWVIPAAVGLPLIARALRHTEEPVYLAALAKQGCPMPYAENNGVRIHYRVVGTGKPVVLHHGFTESIEDWSECGYVRCTPVSAPADPDGCARGWAQ